MFEILYTELFSEMTLDSSYASLDVMVVTKTRPNPCWKWIRKELYKIVYKKYSAKKAVNVHLITFTAFLDVSKL